MSVEAPESSGAGGLSTVVNTIVAPKEAFTQVRNAPTWGWAFLIALVLVIVGTILEAPASRHASYLMTERMMSGPVGATLSTPQKQAALGKALHPSSLSIIWSLLVAGFILLIVAFFNTVFLLIGSIASRGSATFKQLWCGSMNIAVPTYGLSVLVAGLIAMLRGPDAFSSFADISRAVPGLGMLAGNASPAVLGFLSAISVFTIWGLVLNALLLMVTARAAKAGAWTTAILITLIGASAAAGFLTLLARFGG